VSGVLAVIVTGPPGSGKTVALTDLSDALVADKVAHAAVDVDEVAWAYPFPDLAGRCEHLRVWGESHRRAGASLLLVAEVVESEEHLADLLAAIGADDHLLVRLEAELPTLRARIVAREPSGWHSLDHLLAETDALHERMPHLDGIHLVADTERLALAEVTALIRAARPDRL